MVIDGNRGIYSAQAFAERYKAYPMSENIKGSFAILLQGPYTENYHEAWEEVTAGFTVTENGVVYIPEEHDGDIYLMTDLERAELGD